MSFTNNRKLKMKKIYFSAAQSINDDIFRYIKNYINHKQLSKFYNCALHSSAKSDFMIDDCYGAFFHTLCEKLQSEHYYSEAVIAVYDPHYSRDVICQMYIPYKNQTFINIANGKNVCKDIKLYTSESVKKCSKNLSVSSDFFIKAYK